MARVCTLQRSEALSVHNLEVDRDHSYFVGDHGAWVHNTCAQEFLLTKKVASHAAERPYVNSPLTIQEIMATGPGAPDPQGVLGAKYWKAAGSFNGSSGHWELVYHEPSDTVLHFLFKSAK